MSREQRRPNFFIVGAPKCGTSSLWVYLREHPEVFVADTKEPSFFTLDMPGLRQFEREEDYLALFDGAGDEHTAVGEASTWYLHSDAAIPAILRTCPDARIIAMVRNPVQMVQSLHSQFLYDGLESQADFESAWRNQVNHPQDSRLRYARTGELGRLIARARSIVPAERLKVLVFDDFRAQPMRVYREVLDFLGLPYRGRTEFPTYNENKVARSRVLERFIFHTPRPLVTVANLVKRLLGAEELGLMDRIRSLNRKTVRREPISPTLREELRSTFREDVALLSDQLGRDLSAWVA